MVQPIKNGGQKKERKKKTQNSGNHCKRKHKEYGTSKLEEKFAENFLKKIGVEYIYQFKAPTQRVYDFFCPKEKLIIEIDGDYWHSYNVLYEDMTPTQKRNKRVDKEKDHWALINGIPILRIWEHDINKNPKKVMEMLSKHLSSAKTKKDFEDKKKKRDFYKPFKKDDN